MKGGQILARYPAWIAHPPVAHRYHLSYSFSLATLLTEAQKQDCVLWYNIECCFVREKIVWNYLLLCVPVLKHHRMKMLVQFKPVLWPQYVPSDDGPYLQRNINEASKYIEASHLLTETVISSSFIINVHDVKYDIRQSGICRTKTVFCVPDVKRKSLAKRSECNSICIGFDLLSQDFLIINEHK